MIAYPKAKQPYFFWTLCPIDYMLGTSMKNCYIEINEKGDHS